jgi:hypothetical protein
VRFDFLTAANVKNNVLWNVTSRSLVDSYGLKKVLLPT